MSTRALVLSASAALLLVACATARPAPAPAPCPGAPTGVATASKEAILPELATGRRAVAAVRAGKAMVSAANPHATRAGIAVLEGDAHTKRVCALVASRRFGRFLRKTLGGQADAHMA